jgi:hypothetical protein
MAPISVMIGLKTTKFILTSVKVLTFFGCNQYPNHHAILKVLKTLLLVTLNTTKF